MGNQSQRRDERLSGGGGEVIPRQMKRTNLFLVTNFRPELAGHSSGEQCTNILARGCGLSLRLEPASPEAHCESKQTPKVWLSGRSTHSDRSSDTFSP